MEVKNDIKEKVNQLMHEGFEIPMEKLVAEAKLYEDLALDSLDAVDMLVHLEENLGVKVAGEKFIHVRTLADVYKVVEEVVLEAKGIKAPEAQPDEVVVGLGQPQAEIG